MRVKSSTVEGQGIGGWRPDIDNLSVGYAALISELAHLAVVSA